MWYGTIDEALDALDTGELAHLLEELAAGRGQPASPSQKDIWSRSLAALVPVLERLDPSLLLGLEHALPGSNARPDAVLLAEGADGARQVVVIEQKAWDRVGPGAAHLVQLGTRSKLHPSSQAQGYRDYLRDLDASLIDREPPAQVHGCAFLHALRNAAPLSDGVDADAAAVNAALMTDCPSFGRGTEEQLAAWLRARLHGAPSPEFVANFKHGTRRISKRLVRRVGGIRERAQRPWILLESQEEIYRRDIYPALKTATSRRGRVVVLVEGGPGSGKTAIAMTALLDAVGEMGLDAVLVSTSAAQHHSLLGTLQKVDDGKVLPSARRTIWPLLKPGPLRVRTPNRQSSRKQAPTHLKSRIAWAAHCDAWRDDPRLSEAMLNVPRHDVIVVDEAHALVDPRKARVDGSQANAWRRAWGPQVWHLMANSRVLVLLMDADQGYRQVESTKPEDIAPMAERDGLDLALASLGTSQFRLAAC